MGYKLADGSLSTDYEVGDEFVVVGHNVGSAFIGSVVKFHTDDNTSNPWFGDGYTCCSWDSLTPTPETKRKVQARKGKFTINKGDYIDSRELSREECERFCELAVKCGFERGEWADNYQDPSHGYYLQIYRDKLFWCDDVDYGEVNANNITTQFRELLDKEKGMSKFTKDDLKDGMRVELRDGRLYYFCGEVLLRDCGRLESGIYSDDLKSNSTNENSYDIIRVTDRDGTVLFERETEVKEMTVADIERELGYSVKVVK